MASTDDGVGKDFPVLDCDGHVYEPSDDPHIDAEHAWEVIADIGFLGVPEPVVAKLMGSNAACRYAIDTAVHVRRQAAVPLFEVGL